LIDASANTPANDQSKINSSVELLEDLFATALDAVSAARVVPPNLPAAPPGRTLILAVGKAAASMAEVAHANWDGPVSGLACTRYGHAIGISFEETDIELVEAGHPIPDEMSVRGAERALELAAALGEDDLLLAMISGGGSSIWCSPESGITLAEKQALTQVLLNVGANIHDINLVRRCFSKIKGGKLLRAACPARVETLILSDVVNDDPASVASGPTIPAASSMVDAIEIIHRYDIDLPPNLRAFLDNKTSCGDISDQAVTNREAHRIIGSPRNALEAAKRRAKDLGYDVQMLGDAVEGEARIVAREHAALAKEVAKNGKPTVILSGGEVTVTVRSEDGVGGPNTEFLLALALELDAAPGISAIACDTDGYDGVGDNAGAVITPDTLQRANRLHVDPRHFLSRNDAYAFFATLGDLIKCGATKTNVSDFRAIVIDPESN